MRSYSPIARGLAGMVLGLLLSVRLLSPAGFMPSFEHGSVTIVACPDFDPPRMHGPMAGHDHQGPKKLHEPCPYAAGAAAAAISDIAILAALVLVAATLLLGRPSAFVERPRPRERPPSRGPPLTA